MGAKIVSFIGKRPQFIKAAMNLKPAVQED
jgi:hypothetical protein